MVRMRTTSNQSRHDKRKPRTDSHKSSCNCTGCGLLRAGVCINCAEEIAALILESDPRELAVEPCSGACREAIELYFSTPPERWRAQRAF